MTVLDDSQKIDLRAKLVNYSLLALSASIALEIFLYHENFIIDTIALFLASLCFAGACGFSIGNILKLYDDQKDWMADLIEKYSSDWRGWYLFLFGVCILMLVSAHLFLVRLGVLN